MKNMNIPAMTAPVARLPREREMNDIAPAMKIIPIAMITRNTGAARETAASCKGSLVWAMKNVSARL